MIYVQIRIRYLCIVSRDIVFLTKSATSHTCVGCKVFIPNIDHYIHELYSYNAIDRIHFMQNSSYCSWQMLVYCFVSGLNNIFYLCGNIPEYAGSVYKSLTIPLSFQFACNYYLMHFADFNKKYLKAPSKANLEKRCVRIRHCSNVSDSESLLFSRKRLLSK